MKHPVCTFLQIKGIQSKDFEVDGGRLQHNGTFVISENGSVET